MSLQISPGTERRVIELTLKLASRTGETVEFMPGAHQIVEPFDVPDEVRVIGNGLKLRLDESLNEGREAANG